jgi:hypothetical protein
VLGLTFVLFFRRSKEITLIGLLCCHVLYLYFFIHLSHAYSAGNVNSTLYSDLCYHFHTDFIRNTGRSIVII